MADGIACDWERLCDGRAGDVGVGAEKSTDLGRPAALLLGGAGEVDALRAKGLPRCCAENPEGPFTIVGVRVC